MNEMPTARVATQVAAGSDLWLRQDVRYPELFLTAARAVHPRYRRWVRSGTGLVVITAPHSVLNEEESNAIAEYRLRQYVLAGLYNQAVIQQRQLRFDPAVQAMNDDDIHIAVGDTSGRFLCYMCFQSPVETPPAWLDATGCPRASQPTFGDVNRPYFPCESEYGRAIYGGHPGLRDVPLASARELMRLVRNQVTRTPAQMYAIFESLLAVARVACDPSYGLEVIIACASAEVRRLVSSIGTPLAYAPLAPIIGDNTGGIAPGTRILWTSASHAPGRFWPAALSTADVRAQESYYDALDVVLARPVAEVSHELSQLRWRAPQHVSRFVVAPEECGGVFWTADAAYGYTQSCS